MKVDLSSQRSGIPALPPDRSLVAIAAPQSSSTSSLVTLLTINRPASGEVGFLAQQIVQEVLGPGIDLPRWQDRAAAYRAPAASAAARLLISA